MGLSLQRPIISVNFINLLVRSEQLHSVQRSERRARLLPCSDMISCFRREVDDDCASLGFSAASSGNSLPGLQDNFQKSRIQEGQSSLPTGVHCAWYQASGASIIEH